MNLKQNKNKGRLKVLVLLNLPTGNLERSSREGFPGIPAPFMFLEICACVGKGKHPFGISRTQETGD
jgi:hypothetical protein